MAIGIFGAIGTTVPEILERVESPIVALLCMVDLCLFALDDQKLNSRKVPGTENRRGLFGPIATVDSLNQFNQAVFNPSLFMNRNDPGAPKEKPKKRPKSTTPTPTVRWYGMQTPIAPTKRVSPGKGPTKGTTQQSGPNPTNSILTRFGGGNEEPADTALPTIFDVNPTVPLTTRPESPISRVPPKRPTTNVNVRGGFDSTTTRMDMPSYTTSKLQTGRLDSLDFDEILKNQRLYNNYVKCMLETGPCTAEGREIKMEMLEVLHSGCSSCSEKTKQRLRKSFLKMKMDPKYRESYKALLNKYDPDRIYIENFEKFLLQR